MLIPATLFPYAMVTLLLSVVYFIANIINKTDSDIGDGILILSVVLSAFLYWLVSIVLLGIFVLRCFTKNVEPSDVAKSAEIIKIIQIPAYLIMFIWSIGLLAVFFSAPFILIHVLIASLTITMTGILNSAAVLLAKRKYSLPLKTCAVFIITQFMFCIDVFSSSIFCRKVKELQCASKVTTD